MANELAVSLNITHSKNSAVFSRSVSSTISITATAAIHAVQNIGTAEETLTLGDVSPSGYAFFQNLDATNYVEVGKATGVYVLKLKPGEWCFLRLDAWAAIYAKANTAAVDLEYQLFGD